jgi:hypothetical protein
MKPEEIRIRMPVKAPDGRIGIVLNYRLYSGGEKAPGRAAVQFLKESEFFTEGFSIAELEGVSPI